MFPARRRRRAASAAALVAIVAAALTAAPAAAEAATLERYTVWAGGHPFALWKKSAPDARAAILLVHGRTWSALPDFDLQVAGEDLSLMDGLVDAGLDVYAVDLRGYGETPRDASGWLTPGQAADDVADIVAYIGRLHDGPRDGLNSLPHLFGWSMGSTIAQLAVQERPHLVASLTLFGYWRDDDAALPADEPGMEPLRQPNTAESAASDFIVPGSISRAAIDAYVAAALAADPVRVDIRGLDQYNALDAALIGVPTLVIVGEHDPIAPLEFQTRLFERLGTGHKQLVVVPGGDHAAFLEAPRPYFLHALTSFLAGAEAYSGRREGRAGP